jgi:hypothetical protein
MAKNTLLTRESMAPLSPAPARCCESRRSGLRDNRVNVRTLLAKGFIEGRTIVAVVDLIKMGAW